jgi:predicted dehydrogenase
MNLILIGAGSRGSIYARYAFEQGHAIVALAEKDDARRETARLALHVPEEASFRTAEELLSRPRMADAAIIATMDRDHYHQAIAAMNLGYDLLLEKPISPDPAETLDIADTALRLGRRVVVCHVLRYTPFFRQLKEILDSGELGRIIAIEHTENIGNYHIAHSFVRGNWRNEKLSSPIILQKSCHDLDLLLWLAGKSVRRIFSAGSLSFFKEENAPAGSAARCLDCPVSETCRFDGRKVYLPVIGEWPARVLTEDQTESGILEALRTGPYGRCVFRCDNDVCDHQSVTLEYEDGATAAFTLCGMTDRMHRTIHIMCEHGEIHGDDDPGEILITRFRSGVTENAVQRRILIGQVQGAHSGGDIGLVNAFLAGAKDGTVALSDISRSVESHLLAFAAEESRKTGRAVDMAAWVEKLRNH